MRPELRRLLWSLALPLFFVLTLYLVKLTEIGMGWDFTHLGIYPLTKKGFFGIFAHPLVHSTMGHLFANTFPLLFLSWCLSYFFRDTTSFILFFIWIIGGLFTFVIGKPGWHVGASGIIYGLAFFLFFSGLLRRHAPLVAISLLVTFLYGGLVWNMFPQFANDTTSWEGHLGGAIAGTIASLLFLRWGPQRPDSVDEEEEEGEEEGWKETDPPTVADENTTSTDDASSERVADR